MHRAKKVQGQKIANDAVYATLAKIQIAKTVEEVDKLQQELDVNEGKLIKLSKEQVTENLISERKIYMEAFRKFLETFSGVNLNQGKVANDKFIQGLIKITDIDGEIRKQIKAVGFNPDT